MHLIVKMDISNKQMVANIVTLYVLVVRSKVSVTHALKDLFTEKINNIVIKNALEIISWTILTKPVINVLIITKIVKNVNLLVSVLNVMLVSI